jgi:hypothetical protein
MPGEIELTLGDRSSVWLQKAQIISFSAEGSGTRIIVSSSDDRSCEIDVRESFAELMDIMDVADSPKSPGDFIE